LETDSIDTAKSQIQVASTTKAPLLRSIIKHKAIAAGIWNGIS